jgi:hypothetical protein
MNWKKYTKGHLRCRAPIFDGYSYTGQQCRRRARFICGKLGQACCAQHAQAYVKSARRPIDDERHVAEGYNERAVQARIALVRMSEAELDEGVRAFTDD